MADNITIEAVNQVIANATTADANETARNIVLGWELDRELFGTSIFEKVKTYEIVDIKKVFGFIKAEMGIEYPDDERYKKIKQKHHNENEWMKNYKATYNKKKKIFKTGFYLPTHKWGRINPINYLSLCVAHRPTRHSLADDEYIDIDMINAQPVIVYEVAKQNNFNAPGLKDYIDNRNDFFTAIIENHNITATGEKTQKEIAKNLLIQLMFGGSYDGWMNKWKITKKNKLPKIIQIENELSGIMNIVYANNIETIERDVLPSKVAKGEWKTLEEKKRGVMGLWGQSIERLLQETAIKWLVENKDFNIENIVPCQDGFMILKKYYYEDIIKDIEKVIIDTYNIDIKFKVKEFDEKFDIVPFEELTEFEKWEASFSYVPLAERFILEFDNYLRKEIQTKGNLYYVYWGQRQKEIVSVNGRNVIKYKSEMTNPRWYAMNTEEGRSKFRDYLCKDLQYRINFDLASAVDLDDDEYNKLFKKLQSQTEKTSLFTDVEKHIKDIIKKAEKPFNSDAFLLGFENGCIDLRTGEFRGYQYTDYITYSTGYNYYKPDYENNAEDIRKRDLLNTILCEIQPIENERFLLSQVFASGLDGKLYQMIFFLNGEGGNGKGLCGLLMKFSLGGLNYFTAPDNSVLQDVGKNSDAPSPSMMDMKGRRYINFRETGGQSIKKSILKNLTGGGDFKGRAPYEGIETFKLNGTFVMEFNESPEIEGKPDAADYRRGCHILFVQNYTLDERKVGTLNKYGYPYKLANTYYETDEFAEEMKYVFLDYLIGIYQQSLNPENKNAGIQFKIPVQVRERSEAFIKEMDLFAKVFKDNWERVEVKKKEDGKNDPADEAMKTVKIRDLWLSVENSKEYRGLKTVRERRTYGRDAFEKWLVEEGKFTFEIKRKVQVIIGLQQRYNDEEEEDDEEQADNTDMQTVVGTA